MSRQVALDLRCPACHSTQCMNAEDAVPRLEAGLLVCLDCACIYAAMPRWKRDYFKHVRSKLAKKEQESHGETTV